MGRQDAEDVRSQDDQALEMRVEIEDEIDEEIEVLLRSYNRAKAWYVGCIS